jgi:hypothetical protein
MRLIRLGLLVAVALCLSLPHVAYAQNTTIKVTVALPAGVAMPGQNNYVYCALYEGAYSESVRPIADGKVDTNGSAATSFTCEIVIATKSLKPSTSYTVYGAVAQYQPTPRLVLFENNRAISPLSTPTITVDVRSPTRAKRLPEGGSGDVALALGLLLAVIAGGLLLWRQRRISRPALQSA